MRASRSTTRNRHRMRCSSCTQRFTLKRAPAEYKHPPKCPRCRSRLVYSCEAARRRELAKQDTCRCAAYPFPHRAGSLRMCWRHKLADVAVTDQEWLDYQAVIETPRSDSR